MTQTVFQGPAVLIGYEYALQLAADAPVFAQGASFAAQIRARLSATKPIATLSSAGGTLIRMGDILLELRIPAEVSAQMTSGSVLLDVVRQWVRVPHGDHDSCRLASDGDGGGSSKNHGPSGASRKSPAPRQPSPHARPVISDLLYQRAPARFEADPKLWHRAGEESLPEMGTNVHLAVPADGCTFWAGSSSCSAPTCRTS